MENRNIQLKILELPISQTALSPLFKKKAAKLGFETIGDITGKSWTELQRIKKFEYGWYMELIRFLDSNELLALIDRGFEMK